MIVWPGVTEPNSLDQTHMVSTVDFLPTLLDVVGAPHPEGLEGRSFARLLAGDTQKNRDYVIKEYNENAGASRDPMRAVQTRQFLYIFNPWSNGTRVFATATTGTMTYRRLRELAKDQSYFEERHDLYQHRVPEELYDTANDPACLHNLIDVPEMQDELQSLRSKLEDWMIETKDPLLEVFRKREDAAFREAYIQKLEAEALERRKARRNNNNKRKTRNDVISLESPKQFKQGQPIEVTVNYKLPESSKSEKLQVTLKTGENQRIERKIIDITGQGAETVTFEFPQDYRHSTVRIAAFVGPAYGQHLQHINSKPIEIQPR